MKDGDLWDAFGKAADAKNPNAIKLTKVKGHATWQMVKDGTVKPDDRFGNDQSDKAADKGVAVEQPHLIRLAKFYAEKHNKYKICMQKLQRFIITTKRADKKLREAKMKQMDPFENKEHSKANIAAKLDYVGAGADETLSDASSGA